MSAREVKALCADIGGSFIRFGAVYGAGDVEITASVATPAQDWPAFKAALQALCAPEVLRGLPLAIGTAGLYDAHRGTIAAANIPAFAGKNVVQELEEALERRVLIANDADSFALAEAVLGTGRGHDVVMALILGTGVGGGLVVGGHLARGAGGVTGEWGHGAILREQIQLPSGEVLQIPRQKCGCGLWGCTDTIGGARGLERLHQILASETLNSHEILEGWQKNIPKFSRTIDAYLELLAEPLAFAINITGAHIMPVGGGLASCAALIGALDRVVQGRVLHASGRPLIVQGTTAQSGGLLGVSVLALQALEAPSHAS